MLPLTNDFLLKTRRPHINGLISLILSQLPMRTILFVIMLFATKGFTQENKSLEFSSPLYPKISAQDLKEDFQIFRGSLEDFHPGLYWYNSKEEMERTFMDTYTSLNKPLSEPDFFNKITEIISKIGCGHTFTYPSDETSNIMENGLFFPLRLEFIDKKVYYVDNYGNENLPIKPGNEILKINNLSINSLIKVFLKNTWHDGYIETGVFKFIELFFKYRYVLAFGQPPLYSINYIDSSGNNKEFEVKALPLKEIKKKEGTIFDANKDLISLKLLTETSTAILNIDGFDNWKKGRKKKHFEKEIKNEFERIDSAKINDLIIDIRKNGGGNDDYEQLLLSFLISKPFVQYNKLELKINKSKYFKYTNFNRFKIFIHKTGLLLKWAKIKRITDSTFQLKGLKNLKPFPPSSPNFAGNIYILMSGWTFSAASEFSALMKSHPRVTLIGEESGGGYAGNTSGANLKLTLPNTKIEIIIPLIRYYVNVKPPSIIGKGVIPDYEVTQSINDAIKGIDTELNFTFDLIKKNNER